MKTRNRLLSILLAFCLLAGLIPAGSAGVAFAETGTPGSPENPYLISSAEDWGTMDFSKHSHFKLTADITLNTVHCNREVLNGTIDGNGHTITLPAFSVPNSSSEDDVGGLFRVIGSGGVIRNITVQGAADEETIGLNESDHYPVRNIGIIAGINNGTLQKILLTNTKIFYRTKNAAGMNISIGSLVGYNYGTISETYLHNNKIYHRLSDVSAMVCVGGIAGVSHGTIERCIVKNQRFDSLTYYNGPQQSNEEYGLLVGRSWDTLRNCYAGRAYVDLRTHTGRNDMMLFANHLAGGSADSVNQCVYETSGNYIYIYKDDANGERSSSSMTVLCNDQQGSGGQIYGESGEKKAYETLKNLDSAGAWAWNEEIGLLFSWQYTPSPEVAINQIPGTSDHQIQISRSPVPENDMEVTVRYHEKGITQAPETLSVNRAPAQVTSVTLYADNIEKTAIKVHPGQKVQMMARLEGKNLADEESAKVEWTVKSPRDESEAVPAEITQSGMLTVQPGAPDNTIFNVQAKAGEKSMAVQCSVETRPVTLQGLGNELNLNAYKEDATVSFTVKMEGENAPNAVGITVHNANDPNTKAEATGVPNQFILTVGALETSQEIVLRILMDDQTTSDQNIRLLHHDLAVPVIAGAVSPSVLVFAPGDGTQKLKLNLASEPEWQDGTPALDPQYKWMLVQSNPHVSITDQGNQCEIVIDPEFASADSAKTIDVKVAVSAGRSNTEGTAKVVVAKVVGLEFESFPKGKVSAPGSAGEGLKKDFTVNAVRSDGVREKIPQDTADFTVKAYPDTAGVTVQKQKHKTYNAFLKVDNSKTNKQDGTTSTYVTASLGNGKDQLTVSDVLQVERKTKNPLITCTKDCFDFTGSSETQSLTLKAMMGSEAPTSVKWSIQDVEISAGLKQKPTIEEGSGVLTVPKPDVFSKPYHVYKITAVCETDSAFSATRKAEIHIITINPKTASARFKADSGKQMLYKSPAGRKPAVYIPAAVKTASRPLKAKENNVKKQVVSPINSPVLFLNGAAEKQQGDPAVIAPQDKTFQNGSVWVPAEFAKAEYLLDFGTPPAGVSYYYADAGSRGAPSVNIDMGSGKWRLKAGDDGVPKGNIYNGGKAVLDSSEHRILIAVCAKDQNINIERSNTLIYEVSMTSPGTFEAAPVPELSEEKNTRTEVTARTYTQTIAVHGDSAPFAASASENEIIYTALVSKIRSKVEGDSCRDEQRDRALAEGEPLQVNAKIKVNTAFGGEGSADSSVGTVIPAPEMNPNPELPGAMVGDEGIRLSCSNKNVKIFFNITAGEITAPNPEESSVPVFDSAAGEPEIGKTYQYDPARGVPFPDQMTTMRINAIAQDLNSKKNISRVSTALYETIHRKPMDAPVLKIQHGSGDMVSFNPDGFYEKEGIKLYLDHPSIKNVKIHYTVSAGGTVTPSVSSPEYIPFGPDGERLPLVLPDDLSENNQIVVKIVMLRENRAPVSADYIIQFTGSYALPHLYYALEDIQNPDHVIIGSRIQPGEKIMSGTQFILRLDPHDLPAEMTPEEKPVVKIENVTAEDGSIVVENGKYTLDAEQKEQRVDLAYREYIVPDIEYALSQSGELQPYRQERPVVFQTVRNLDQKTADQYPDRYNRYESVPAQLLTFDAVNPGETVTLKVKISGSDQSKQARVETLTFTIQENLPVPTVHVQTEPGEDNLVKVNTPISLECAATKYEIYYTIRNEEITKLDILKSRNWEDAYTEWLRNDPAGPQLGAAEISMSERHEYRQQYIDASGVKEPPLTMYTIPFPVKRNSQKSFWLRTVAVSADHSMGNSPVGKTMYYIKELDPAQAVEASPATSDAKQTSLRRGEPITLSTKTENPKIYYTTDGSVPHPDEYLKCKTDEERAGCSTQCIDSGGQVLMNPENRTFTIRAVARENSDPSVLSDSKESRFVYQLARAELPDAVPKTNSSADPDTEPAKLAPGATINLRIKGDGTKVYYTTDGTVPVVPAKGKEPVKPTAEYDPSQGIEMQRKDTFFILTAIVHDPSGNTADSEPVTYYYQNPAAVQAVYAIPAAGQPVVKGQNITLNCTTEGAKIFYEVSYDGKDPAEPQPYVSQTFDASRPIRADQPLKIKAMAEKDGMMSKTALYSYTIAEQLDSPKASLASGSIVFPGAKLHLYVPENADAVYTKDGSDPSDEENKNRLYGSDLILDGKPGESMTIRTFSTRSLATPSEIKTFTYSICSEEEVLMANPAPGTGIPWGTVVNLSTPVSNGQIYWSTNGDDPVTQGTAGQAITLKGVPGELIVLKAAVGVKNEVTGAIESSVPMIFTYQMQEQTQSPTASIPSGAITLDGAEVVLSVENGSIYYTTDGSEPTTSSVLYTEPVRVAGSMVLKAIAAEQGKAESKVVTYVYTRAGDVAAPVSSIPSGEIVAGTAVVLTTATKGADIYYSTNGLDPNDQVRDELLIYTGPVSVTRPVTLKFYACKEGMHSSPANSVSYTVLDPPEPEAKPEPPQGLQPTVTDRLTSRRTFDDVSDGPSYSDIVLYDRQYSAVVSGTENSIPQETVLTIHEIPHTEEDQKTVQQSGKELEILKLYGVDLIWNGEHIQPQKEIEIGLPIPSEYQNGVVMICSMDDYSSAEFLPTRRSGGMAYVKTESLGKYAVVAASRSEPDSAFSKYLIPVGIALASAAVLMILLAIRRKKKQKDSMVSEEE